MNVAVVIIIFVIYMSLLLIVSRLTTLKGTDNDQYFTGSRQSPWVVVAYGMIGTLLSGVTFMSVPGYVRETQFTYLGVVIGNFVGIFVIAFLLLPLYYRLNMTSIYTYLGNRFGPKSEKTGAFLFIGSRLMGSALRMYMVVFVLHEFCFKPIGMPFWLITVILIGLILLYTFRGGIKTVVWTDVFQTTAMLLAVGGTFVFLLNALGRSPFEILKEAQSAGMTQIYESDWRSPEFFWKQFGSGIAGMIAMTGLDQDMMQKNLSCRNIKEAQKNMLVTGVLLLLVNIVFLVLGVMLLTYANETGFVLPEQSDSIFSSIALSAGSLTAVLFMIGLVAAGFSSADGSLASLTTAFCINVVGFEVRSDLSEEDRVRIRKIVHVIFAVLFFLIIVIFNPFHTSSLIAVIFKIAGYTYGPLLGMFCFGMFIKDRRVNDKAVPFIAVFSPVASYLINMYSEVILFGYRFGFEILLLNALITFVGLFLFSSRITSYEKE